METTTTLDNTHFVYGECEEIYYTAWAIWHVLEFIYLFINYGDDESDSELYIRELTILIRYFSLNYETL